MVLGVSLELVNTEHELITLGFNFLAVFVIQYIIRNKDEIEDNKLLQTPQIDAKILTIGQE